MTLQLTSILLVGFQNRELPSLRATIGESPHLHHSRHVDIVGAKKLNRYACYCDSRGLQF